jgi:WD40 repeat protein
MSMRRAILVLSLPLVTGLALAAAPAAQAAAGARAAARTAVTHALARSQPHAVSPRWVRSYHAAQGESQPFAEAASPDGAAVYVTGYTDQGDGYACLTVAYNASTGATLWSASYAAAQHRDMCQAVAGSPDGTAVYVTGLAYTGLRSSDLLTLAYNASTGAQLWSSATPGPKAESTGLSITVSPDGSAVYVAARNAKPPYSYVRYLTVAYQAGTGQPLWTASFYRPGWNASPATVLATAAQVLVTGVMATRDGKPSHALTVAYNASTGAQLWAQQYAGPDNNGEALSAALSPDGSTVYIGGDVTAGQNVSDLVVVAYDTATGAQRWAARYRGPTAAASVASDSYVAVSPDGTKVFLAGGTIGTAANSEDYATIAYSAATGTQLWAVLDPAGPNKDDLPSGVAVNPAGTSVYVTGSQQVAGPDHYDYGTVAYAAASGAPQWSARYGTAGPGSMPLGIAAAGSGVFVTGADPFTGPTQWATVGYPG